MAAAEGLRLVLVGPPSPLGAELKRRLALAALPWRDVLLADFDPLDDEGAQRLVEYDGAAALVADAAELRPGPGDVLVVSGDRARSADLLENAAAAHACIDLTGCWRRRESIPWAHADLQSAEELPAQGRIGAPQPVSATLASLLGPLARAGLVEGASGTVLLPAAAVGEGAVEELYQQTVGLLNFTDIPKEVLSEQVAFNVLQWEGAELATDLAWEVERLLGDGGPRCDLQILMASTFHGHGFSVRIWGPEGATEKDVARTLQAAGLQVSDGPASAVAAGEGGGTLLARPRKVADGVFWLWAVADSIGDGAVENVVRLSRGIVAAGAAAAAGSGGGADTA